MKYTKEILEDAILKSKSIREVLKRIGSSPFSGGSHRHISKKIEKYNIDISHFNPYANCKGRKNKTSSEILVMGDNKISTCQLKRALFEIGRPYRCEECGIDDKWNNKPLVLQIDHKDGNVTNNISGNLRFLCPNCHTQTPTYGVLKTLKVYKCKKCENKIRKDNKSGYCCECYWKSRSERRPKPNLKPNPKPRKSKCPGVEILKELVWKIPTTKIATQYGVSDNAVTKWCKKHEIKKPGPGYWSATRNKI